MEFKKNYQNHFKLSLLPLLIFLLFGFVGFHKLQLLRELL